MKGNTGNPHPKPWFRGGPGSGRPSIRHRRPLGRKIAKEEHDRHMEEYELMYSPQDVEAIKEKIRRKQPISAREVMLLKEMGGSERLLAKHFEKVVPSKTEYSGPEGKPIPILNILAKGHKERDQI